MSSYFRHDFFFHHVYLFFLILDFEKVAKWEGRAEVKKKKTQRKAEMDDDDGKERRLILLRLDDFERGFSDRKFRGEFKPSQHCKTRG